MRSHSGFTLIELLVVAAIIGLIASVISASLTTARSKAYDASVKEQAMQLRILLEQEFNETGSYAGLKAGGGWYGVGETCSGFSGSFATNAVQVCTSLVRSTGTPCGNDGCVYFRTVDLPGAPTDSPTHYSIVAYLQGASKAANDVIFLCIGSSGRTSQTPDPFASASPGCYDNP